MNVMDYFDLSNKIVLITGGAGMLGRKHAEAVIEAGGTAVLLDIWKKGLDEAIYAFNQKYGIGKADGFIADITSQKNVSKICATVMKKYGHVDALINNAANNPKVEDESANMNNIKFENLPIKIWEDDLKVGLTGAMICTQVFGAEMAKAGSGVILNISSDLGIIAPDQRIYRRAELQEEEQMVKPVTYSVIKHGLIGLTKYTATYWAEYGVRANTICPAGVFNGQNSEFLKKLKNLIPMGRMASKEEYKATILYMISDASAYMTGSTVVIDGGRTCW